MKTLLALLLVLTLHAENSTTLTVGDTGAMATDDRDGDVPVTITGEVNSSKVGTYLLIYSASDTVGNEANVTRTVTIQPAPVTLQSLTLTIAETSLNRETNTTLKVEASYDNNTTKDVTDTVAWLIDHPDAVGIQSHILTAKQDINTTLRAKLGDKTSNAVSLNLYWEVNGYRLPPEPDKAINDSTLLGIDINHNGVRDDVERKVYATYKKAVERAVMMQAFRTEQAMLADPDLVKNAREWERKVWKAYSCKNYLADSNKMKYIKSTKLSKNIENWQFNTEKRVKNYFRYDQALSGGVYSIKDGTLQDCEFDVEKVLEMDR